VIPIVTVVDAVVVNDKLCTSHVNVILIGMVAFLVESLVIETVITRFLTPTSERS
jgi:hypothetical protein